MRKRSLQLLLLLLALQTEINGGYAFSARMLISYQNVLKGFSCSMKNVIKVFLLAD